MTANMGSIDRAIRLVLGVVLIIAPLMNVPAIWTSTAFQAVSVIIGLVLVGTASFRFCPLYRIIGISTRKP